jgi:hypothetical protein
MGLSRQRCDRTRKVDKTLFENEVARWSKK